LALGVILFTRLNSLIAPSSLFYGHVLGSSTATTSVVGAPMGGVSSIKGEWKEEIITAYEYWFKCVQKGLIILHTIVPIDFIPLQFIVNVLTILVDSTATLTPSAAGGGGAGKLCV
jgi:hypothetical protein